MKQNTPIRRFTIFALIIASFLSACYEPVANTDDSFKNDRRASAETTYDSNSANNAGLAENDADTNTMNDSTEKTETSAAGFRENLIQMIARHGYKLSEVVDESSDVERRLLDEYGAVFLTKAVPPSKVMFTGDGEVEQFQAKTGHTRIELNGIAVELQADAAKALTAAYNEAKQKGMNITPADPEDSARRSYSHTRKLWDGRFNNACEHWLKKGKLTAEKISSLRSEPIKQQVASVLQLERQGIFFSTAFDKSILYSVAAPGTSQHLSMLAFDAKEYGNESVRKILAKYGWFRTVKSDAPHFTFLGYDESELTSLGLKKVSGGFWIPDV
ncbi:MAG: hypothetical protein R2681_07665 [Pyrinomonadaceae bacterium]